MILVWVIGLAPPLVEVQGTSTRGNSLLFFLDMMQNTYNILYRIVFPSKFAYALGRDR
jgi:hypothetical protein